MAAIEAAENEVQKWKVPELKSYLQSRGITVSQKRKEELVELVEKARDLSLEPIDDGEKPEDVNLNLCRPYYKNFLKYMIQKINPSGENLGN